MGYDRLLTPEMITAFAVFFGALFGGVVAVIAELRKPPEAPKVPEVFEPEAVQGFKELIAAIQEETDHVNRTLWVIEKKLSEHLHRIEKGLAARLRD